MKTIGTIEINGTEVEYVRVPEMDRVFFQWQDARNGDSIQTSVVYQADIEVYEMISFLDTKVNCTRTIGGILNYARKISDETESDIFVEYSPHVNWLSIRIHAHGWKANITADYKAEWTLTKGFYDRIEQGKEMRAFIDESLRAEEV